MCLKPVIQHGEVHQLIGAILSPGTYLPDYFRDECARLWASIVGLDPRYLYELAIKGTSWEGMRAYSPLTHEQFTEVAIYGAVYIAPMVKKGYPGGKGPSMQGLMHEVWEPRKIPR